MLLCASSPQNPAKLDIQITQNPTIEQDFPTNGLLGGALPPASHCLRPWFEKFLILVISLNEIMILWVDSDIFISTFQSVIKISNFFQRGTGLLSFKKSFCI